MTEQSPTAQFNASSFLDGANAGYVDQLQARYAADPNAVDAQWAEFFRTLGDSELDAKRAAQGPRRCHCPGGKGEAVLKAIKR